MDTFICPNCGLKQPPAILSYQLCRECIKKVRTPEEGWPIDIRWVSASKGRGVFATRDIKVHETIELCHAIAVSSTESEELPKSLPTFVRYMFPWPHGKCFLTGSGLIYNHNSLELTGASPNMDALIYAGALVVEFRALRNIHAGEELTYNYKGIRGGGVLR